MAKKSVPQPRLTKLSVYLYIPNIIGEVFMYLTVWYWLNIVNSMLLSNYIVKLYTILQSLFILTGNAGYIRVLMNCYAFAICFSNKQLFSFLYFVR